MTDDEPPPRIDSFGMEYAYAQVARDIERLIAAGRYPPGSRLPARAELAAYYGVAEMTVRRAVRELAARGLVRSVPSKGVFVLPPGHVQGT
jgi:DNA-binding GntR family transcriptional regulator